MGIIDTLVKIGYNIYLRLPATKKEVLTAKYEMKILLDAIKEIEAINRNDISGLIFKVKDLEEKGNKSKSKPNTGVQYQ